MKQKDKEKIMMPMDCFSIHEHKYLDDFNKVKNTINEITDMNNLRCTSKGNLIYEMDSLDAEKILRFIDNTDNFIENYKYFYDKIRSITNEFI